MRRSSLLAPFLCLLLAALSCAGGREFSTPTAPRAEGASIEQRAEILRAEDRRVIDDALRAGFDASDIEIRVATVRAVGRIGDPAGADLLLGALDDPVASVRAEAAFGLGLLGARKTLSALHDATSDEDPTVRARTADALGLIADPSSADSLLAMMSDPDDGVAVAACYAVSRQPSASFALDGLLRLVDHGRPVVQLAALQSLAMLTSRPLVLDSRSRTRGREFLGSLRKSQSAEVRFLVAQGLSTPVAPPEAEMLGEMLQNDPDPLVRAQAVAGLGFPAAPLEPFVPLALADSDDRVVLAGIHALSRMRGPEILETLARFVIDDDRLWLRREAILAMRDAEPLGAAAVVAGLSRNPEPELREAAARLLHGHGDATSLRIATDLLHDDDERVRTAAVPVLAAAGAHLSTLLGAVATSDDPARVAAVARAAGLRLADPSRDAKDRADAFALLDSCWERVRGADRIIPALAVVDAAGMAGPDQRARAILESAAGSRDYAVRTRAAGVLRDVHGIEIDPRPAADRPLENYVEILRWADEPRSAIVTVERPGFIPGAFTFRLDTRRAPLNAWNFSRLAGEKFFDGLWVGPVIPPRLAQLGLEGPDGLMDPGRSVRGELSSTYVPPGTVAMAGPQPDVAGASWFVAITPQPQMAGRYTTIGRVVQNFPGVAALLLPGDRIVSVEVYAGDGTEPVPIDF